MGIVFKLTKKRKGAPVQTHDKTSYCNARCTKQKEPRTSREKINKNRVMCAVTKRKTHALQQFTLIYYMYVHGLVLKFHNDIYIYF